MYVPARVIPLGFPGGFEPGPLATVCPGDADAPGDCAAGEVLPGEALALADGDEDALADGLVLLPGVTPFALWDGELLQPTATRATA